MDEEKLGSGVSENHEETTISGVSGIQPEKLITGAEVERLEQKPRSEPARQKPQKKNSIKDELTSGHASRMTTRSMSRLARWLMPIKSTNSILARSHKSSKDSVSVEQIEIMYKTKCSTTVNEGILDKKHLEDRLSDEKQVWHEQTALEEQELQQQWDDMLQQRADEDRIFERQQQEKQELLERQKQEKEDESRRLRIQKDDEKKQTQESLRRRIFHLKRQREVEKRSFEHRRQSELNEINRRIEREQHQLDADYNDILADRGLKPKPASLPAHGPLTSQTALLLPSTQMASNESPQSWSTQQAQSGQSAPKNVLLPSPKQSSSTAIKTGKVSQGTTPTQAGLSATAGASASHSLPSCMETRCPQNACVPATSACVAPTSGVCDSNERASAPHYERPSQVAPNVNHEAICSLAGTLPISQSSVSRFNGAPAVCLGTTIPTYTRPRSSQNLPSPVFSGLIHSPNNVPGHLSATAMTTAGILSYQNPSALPTCSAHVPAHNESSVPSHHQPVYVVKQPDSANIEPIVFGGDGTEYTDFIDLFDEMIKGKNLTEREKFMRLLKFTTGVPQALVKGCKHEPDHRCFDEAIRQLSEFYGQPFQISSNSINSVLNGPQLSEANLESIMMFLAKLNQCVGTLTKIECLEEVGFTMIQQIALRLPEPWEPGWRALVDYVLHGQKVKLSLIHLASYTKAKARELSNKAQKGPSSTIAYPKHSHNRPVKPIKTVYATQVLENQSTKLACYLCEKPHFLNQCFEFRKMKYKERKRFTINRKLCFVCLKPGHFKKDCERQNPCVKSGCSGRHTTLLHPPDDVDNVKPSRNDAAVQTNDGNTEPATTNEPKVTSFFNASHENGNVLLNVIPVKLSVKGSQKSIPVLALFDNASNCSFISESLMEKLELVGPKVDVDIQTISPATKNVRTTVVKNLQLSDFKESEYASLGPLLSSEAIVVDKGQIPTQNDVDQYREFQNIVIPELNEEVGLLIGKDHPMLHKPLEVTYGPNNYFAIKCFAGWMVTCPKNGAAKKLSTFFTKSNLCQMCCDVMDSTGPNEKREYSQNEQVFLDKVQRSINLTPDGHYEIELPLKDENIWIRSNRIQAEQRMLSLKRRFQRDSEYHGQYSDFVCGMLKSGHAEETKDLIGPEGRTRYLCHHGVFHPTKGTLRVVHDGAAKFDGICLNDLLLQGPDLTNNLVGVLTRFRKNAVAVQGDIKSMYYQVKIAESDRDLLRFLFWEDGDPEKPLKTYRMTVLLFGGVCSPSCANFALRQTAENNKQEYEKDVVDAVYDSFYVDDFLDSKPDVPQAISHVKNVSSLIAKGGFRITKWASNSREVLAAIPEDDRAKDLRGLDLASDDLPVERALGLMWDIEHDTLSFRVSTKEKPVTRRGMLSTVNSIFDPLGMGQPISQPMKVLMQGLCKRNFDWDEPVPHDIQVEWLKSLKNYQN